MSIISIVFNFLLAVFSIMVFIIVPIFVLLAIFCIPYALYVGCYRKENNLPDDFRKFESVKKEVKYAAKFYWDLLHLRKPTLK